MEETIKRLLTPAKGLLAADESSATIQKRFSAVGLTSTPEINREYRELLFTTPGIEEYISGVILFDETVNQKTSEGIFFVDYLNQKGIVPGIKVDEGLEQFSGTDEKITKGLEGLEIRLKDYANKGLKFTKWRAVYAISDIYPSEALIEESLNRMVKYAKLSQDTGLVPIVEPEVLLDGLHTTTRCAEISVVVLKTLFEKLQRENVLLDKLILKPSMILPGKDNGVKAEPLEVASATLRTLNAAVPREVPGIVFLSGGQPTDQVTANLNKIIKIKADAPWELSFSFGRALQEEAIKTWQGKEENKQSAQEVFKNRAKLVSQARKGELAE